jgi:hypothetical protein
MTEVLNETCSGELNAKGVGLVRLETGNFGAIGLTLSIIRNRCCLSTRRAWQGGGGEGSAASRWREVRRRRCSQRWRRGVGL